MDVRPLQAALLKLRGTNELPASQFTDAQRKALNLFAQRTRAVICQQQGRGNVYRVKDTVVVDAHLSELSPQTPVSSDLPKRAQNIARARNSKAGKHKHDCYYPILKAIGNNVIWHEKKRGLTLHLSQRTRNLDAVSLKIEPNDAWCTPQDLWLVENQAPFDHVGWLPKRTNGTLCYYRGEIDGRLLEWLSNYPRASRIVHFPDYDGTGLLNFAKLYKALGDSCTFWLMPDWSRKLKHYGNNAIWRKNLDKFSAAVPQLPDYLTPLVQQMRQSGLALEQESVWLNPEKRNEAGLSCFFET